MTLILATDVTEVHESADAMNDSLNVKEYEAPSPADKNVPVSDAEMFEEWSTKADPVFIDDFIWENIKQISPALMKQTLHSAERANSGLLELLHFETLQKGCVKAFPNKRTQFPKKKKALCIQRLRKYLQSDRDAMVEGV